VKALVLSLTILVGAAAAQANPLDAFGYGSRAAAMGGAATAASEDSGANYYNPGGLARGRDLRIDLGYRYAQPLLRFNHRRTSVDASRGLAVGLVAPANIGQVHFAFGTSLWLPDQRLTRVHTLPYEQPRFVLFDNLPQRLVFSANLAVQIWRGLYLGGGLTFMSRTSGQVLLRGAIAFTDPDLSQVVSNVNVDLVTVRYPQAGLLWDVGRNLSLGLSYRHSFVLALDQQFRLDGSIGDPGLRPILPKGYFQVRSIASDLFQPWELTSGMAVRLWHRLLVTVDATYARWSEFPVPAATLTLGIDVGMFNDRVKLPPPRACIAGIP
jgi:long-chain fatty acid transport protein